MSPLVCVNTIIKHNQKFAFLCVYMWVLVVHLCDKHKGSKHRQNDRPRREDEIVFLLMRCGSQPQAALTQLLLHMTPVCVRRPGPRAPTRPPRSSYICLNLSLRDTALSKKIHCMQEQQPKYSYSTTTGFRASFQFVSFVHVVMYG